MSKLRKAVTVGVVAALTTFGVAACGGDTGSSSGGGGTGGGEINVTMTSFPDYVDPQLSYTVEGWEVLYNTYTPLLTYKHAKGEEGTEVVPGLAEAMPEVSPDGKTYKLKLRPEHEVLRRHADQGVRLHLRHPAAVQGQLRRLGVLRDHRRRQRTTPTARPTRSAASPPTTPPATSPSR